MKDQKIKGTHNKGLKSEKSAIYGMWRKILRSTSARPSGKIVPLFKNKRFVLNEKLPQNALKFAILLEYKNSCMST